MASIKPHPAADIFPMLDDPSYEKLKADIDANGLKEPLVYFKGQLLDGRNRLRACKELGIDPSECELDEDQDPLSFVLSANLHRRQLKPSQRAMCAARLANLPNGSHGKSSVNLRSFTCESASELFGVSTKAIEQARKVLRHGCRELIELCESGRSVATACNLIDSCDSKKEQAAIAKDGWKTVRDHVSTSPKETKRVKLPDNPDSAVVAEVDAWLEQQDERPAFERFKAIWDSADDMGKAAIRAFMLDQST